MNNTNDRAKVGDSRFESWYSEKPRWLTGDKQAMRDAYEAGLNEAQQVALPKVTVELPDGDERTVKTWFTEMRNGELVVSISVEAQQVAVPASDFDMRGVLASKLMCWHRLTEAEAQDLICFFEKVRVQQVAVPMTEDEIEAACRFIEPSLDGPIAYDLLIARAIEKHHGIGAKK